MKIKITPKEMAGLENLVNSWLQERKLIDPTQSIIVNIVVEKPKPVIVQLKHEGNGHYCVTEKPLETSHWTELLNGSRVGKLRDLMELFRKHDNRISLEDIPAMYLRRVGDKSFGKGKGYFPVLNKSANTVRLHRIGVLKTRYKFAENSDQTYRVAICEWKSD